VTKDGEVVETPDYRTRVAARKEASAVRKDIAQARGVVTKREGVLVGNDPDNPLPPGVIDLRVILGDPEKREKVADLATDPEAEGTGEDQPGGPGEGADAGTMETRSAP